MSGSPVSDDFDLLSLAEAKLAINYRQQSTDIGEKLALHVTSVSRAIEDRCGYVVAREITGELCEPCGHAVVLRHWPVLSVEQVRVASCGAPPTTVDAWTFGGTASGYRLHELQDQPGLYTSRLERIGECWPYGQATVEVSYTAGRCENTHSVDRRFKGAAGAVLRRLWKREAGAWAQSSTFFTDEQEPTAAFFNTVDALVKELLASDRRPKALVG